jgi:hypothetical protein
MATRKHPTPNVVEAAPDGARADSAAREDDKTSRNRPASRAEQSENTIEPAVQAQATRSARASSSGKESAVATGNDTASVPAGQVLPEHITTRYLRSGKDFHFPNRDLAFTDHGHKLSTKVQNTEVIADLIDIAKTRGWDDIKLGGSKEFRQEAWVQASVAGLSVRNYRATELDQEVLRRRLGKTGAPEAAPDLNGQPSGAASPTSSAPAMHKEQIAAKADARADREPAIGETFTGRLVRHGVESNEYAVELNTGRSSVTLRGEDLQRAVKESLSRAKVGDEVSIRYFGPETVTVIRPVRSDRGDSHPESFSESTVKRWGVERTDFWAERAALSNIVRDPSVDAQSAVRKYPALAGTYSELQAAHVKAQQHYSNSAADQQDFVSRVRTKLAQDIERGKSLPVNRLPTKAPARESRERVQERTL